MSYGHATAIPSTCRGDLEVFVSSYYNKRIIAARSCSSGDGVLSGCPCVTRECSGWSPEILLFHAVACHYHEFMDRSFI